MVTAFVLLNIERDLVKSFAEQLIEMDGVSEVHSIAGRYDLIAVLRVATNERLADLVTEEIRHLDGIIHSETLIGFRVYSKHDLEHLFAIGM